MIRTGKFFRSGCIATALLVLAATGMRAADDANQPALSALLKKQTQEMSDAGQRGDAAVLNRFLDDDVVFTNETGAISTKKEMVESTSPPPAGTPIPDIKVTHWALRQQGDVATATFIDELTQHFLTQSIVLQFQSTETWAKRPGGWKMIASQTMNVVQPPKAILLPRPELDSYVGIYQLDAAHVVKISRDGDNLLSSLNGGAASPLQVEVKDVLFSPAVPNARKIFQRDAGGRIVGYISRRDGSDLVFTKTG